MTAASTAGPSGGQPPPLAGAGPVDTTGMAEEPRRGSPPPELLARVASTSLDPATAVRFGHQTLQSTVYATSRLLVRPTAAEEEVVERLRGVADAAGFDLVVNPVDERMRTLAREAGIGPDEPQPLLVRVELQPRYDDGPAGPPDAWPVLQAFRNGYPAGSPERASVQLDHVLTSHDGGVTGTPYWHGAGTTGSPYWHGAATGNPYLDVPGGVAEYATPGFGGRAPVAWVGPEPIRTPDDQLEGRRRPVVAVLDTGIGRHRWFEGDVVDRRPTVGGLAIGLTDPATAPEDEDVIDDSLSGELGVTSGHGTFIAGLVRQKCPDARLLAVRVLQADGVVAEADLLEALNLLWLRQCLALDQGRPEDLVDVVSMSLGYYHESAVDVAFDALLLAPLRALARLGVVVVVSAGNDATLRPMYPAAFSPHAGGPVPTPLADELPVVAVGATNPDRSVALFSNEGPWVHAHRPGAALVSTLPPFDGSRQPSTRHATRATLDPDDFSSGFGVWSGTSFAAPVLVGEIAQHLHAAGLLPATGLDAAAAVERGWQAVTARVPSLVRPAAADGQG